MLVTFSCDAYENITMFGNVALQLIKMMGQSDHVPGAILAENVSDALAELQGAIELEKQKSNDPVKQMDDSDEEVISLSHRVLPLIKLLQAAIKKNCDVMWA